MKQIHEAGAMLAKLYQIRNIAETLNMSPALQSKIGPHLSNEVNGMARNTIDSIECLRSTIVLLTVEWATQSDCPEEPTECYKVVKYPPDNKIMAIKAMRTFGRGVYSPSDLGLKEAKDAIEQSLIVRLTLEGVKALEAVGCEVAKVR